MHHLTKSLQHILLFVVVFFNTSLFATIVGTTKGEFSVNQGTANYSLKIDVPQGVAGMEPKLSLDYASSNTNNGYLGLGWNIGGTSTISRCSQTKAIDGDAHAFGVNYTSSDRFCLDGQRLIAINGEYGVEGTEYRTEINSYSKIISRGDVAGAPAYFEVQTKSGLTYFMGRDNGSALLTKEDGVIRFWKVGQIKDTYGNTINFHYVQNVLEGYHYLDKVSYADNEVNYVYESKQDVTKGYHGGYPFLINKRLKEVVVKSGSIEVRRYVMNYGFHMQPYLVPNFNIKYGPGVTPPTIRPPYPYPTQNRDTYVSKLHGIQETAGGETLKRLDFTWQSTQAKGFAPYTPWKLGTKDTFQSISEQDKNGVYTTLRDMNGDGLLDKVMTKRFSWGWSWGNYTTELDPSLPAGIYIALNNGSGFNDFTLWMAANQGQHPYNYITGSNASGTYETFMDMNGDGLPDRVIHYNYRTKTRGLFVALNTGSGFKDFTLWMAANQGQHANNYITGSNASGTYSTFMDMNGDGLPDRVIHYNYKTKEKGLFVALNTGSGFKEFTLWMANNQGQEVKNYITSINDSGTYNTFMDMNGDGLPDRVIHYHDKTKTRGLFVALNTGSGFKDFTLWMAANQGQQPNNFIIGRNASGTYSTFMDMNGDGLPDRVIHYNYKTKQKGLFVALNTGSGFNDFTLWMAQGFGQHANNYLIEKGTFWASKNTVSLFIDMNGDKLPDRVQYDGSWAVSPSIKVALNTGSGFNAFEDYVMPVPKFWWGGITIASSTYGNDPITRTSAGLIDMNGDGFPDRVMSGKGVSLNTASKPLITKISNHTDQDIAISYKPMTDDAVYYSYTKHGQRNSYAFNDSSNDNIEVASGRSLVYAVKSANGVGGYNALRYKYYGNIINKIRGSQGFHQIDIYDETSSMLFKTFYTQITKPKGEGFQYTGLPYYSENVHVVGTPLEYTKVSTLDKTVVAYKDASSQTRIYEPYTYSNIQTIHDPDSNTAIKSVYHYNYVSSDGLGNIEKTVDRTQDLVNSMDFIKTTYNSYGAEDENAWQIGRLTAAQVVHTQTGGTPVVRASAFSYNAKGVLSQETANAQTPSALTKSYTYDAKGNKISETVMGANIPTTTTTFAYDAQGKFQTQVTDATGLSVSKTYDARFGTLTSLTDANGLTTRWAYDALGRKISQTSPDGFTTTWTHTWDNGSSVGASFGLYAVEVKGSSTAKAQKTYYDAIGREVASAAYVLDKRVLKLKTYNAKGELIEETLPFYEGDSVSKILTQYDKYGRATSVSKPGPAGSVQTYSTAQSNFTTIVTDPNGNQKQTIENAIGQTIQITDALGSGLDATIDYRYDAFGNLLSTTDSDGNVIRMAYDVVGNKVYMDDPDLGVWNYSYNALGQMVQQSNAQGQQTTLTYDDVGRLTHKISTEGNSKEEASYVYGDANAQAGSKGKLLSVQSNSLLLGSDPQSKLTKSTYDTLGRVVQTETTIGGRGTYLSTMAYDAFSRPLTLTYPNAYSVSNHYDANSGLLDSVVGSDGTVHYTIDQLTALGEVSKATFGNGVKTLIGHDNAGFTGNIISYGASPLIGGVQRLDYSYDKLGNVLSREDTSISGKDILDTFGYDAMNRLTSQETSSDVIGNYEKHKVYSYDALGNMTFQTGLGAYTYNTDKPHAVKTVGSRNYTYDSIGNMTNRNGDSIVYNPLNKPAILTNHLNGKEVRFYYGADGARYMKSTQKTDTYYLGKGYEEQVEGSTEKQICYISMGGKTIGSHIQVRNTDYAPTNSHYLETPYNRYFHTDALGSITAVTDDNGTVVERRSYEAFGKIRAMDYGLETAQGIIEANTVSQTTRAYTGHEQIAELSGLVHMNARVYDSDIGRFLSADTIIQAPHDSQSYNRYSYVRNNPLVFTDPSGHSWFSKIWKKIKKWVRTIVSIVVAVVIAIYAPQFLALFIDGASAFGVTVATGALAGFASGAIMTGSLRGALKGALFGAIGAGVAGFIGHGIGLEGAGNLFAKGVNAGKLFIKSALHGLSRGIISMAQGGTFRSGFASGFASSFFSPGTSLGGEGTGGFTLRTTIASIVGGTASALGGGKFSNGAVSGAFVHMFNAEGGAKKIVDSTSEAVSHYYNGKGQPVELGIKTKLALRTNQAQINHLQNIVSGRTSSLTGNYGIDLTGSATTFHVGDTRVDYFTSCTSYSCTTTFVGFSGDGFWDIYGGSDYGGPQGELGGTPYAYKPYMWTETYSNPYNK